MSEYPVIRGPRPGDPHPTLRLAALTAVIAGVILVAAAAFLLSYEGIHHIALQAGVSPTLARLYPLMFDAMLVIACAATLALRNAGWGSKLYVWVSLLLLVGAVAVGDALHATGVKLTGQPARAIIAIIPWALLLMGFGLWLVMLRQWRRSRAMAAASEAGRTGPAAVAGAAAGPAAGGAVTWAGGRGAAPARPGASRTGIDALMGRPPGRPPERPPAVEGPPAGRRASAEGQRAADLEPAGTGAARDGGRDMAADAAAEGGVTFEALPSGHTSTADAAGTGSTAAAGTRPTADAGSTTGARSPAEDTTAGEGGPAHGAGTRDGADDPAVPSPAGPAPASLHRFDRLRSTPTPPQDAEADGE